MVVNSQAEKLRVLSVLYDEDLMDFLQNAFTFYDVNAFSMLHRPDWMKEINAKLFDLILLDVSFDKDHGRAPLMAIKNDPLFESVRIVTLSSFTIQDKEVAEWGAEAALQFPFELSHLVSTVKGKDSVIACHLHRDIFSEGYAG